jgi:hypothetical protein
MFIKVWREMFLVDTAGLEARFGFKDKGWNKRSELSGYEVEFPSSP